MFVHKNQLAYQLAPERYFTAESHIIEHQRLFLPTWHFVATKDDLPHDGDFLCLRILDQPLLVRNFSGSFHAFLNVCSHRHSALTDLPGGNSPHLKCQYHGWQYEASGKTAKIPDAGCFRPFDREQARLHKFRLEECGNLLFVSLVEDGPTLRQYLGEFYDIAAERTSQPWRQVLSTSFDYPCNWKLTIENTVESYHVPCVHSGAFAAVYPSEENHTHILHDDYTTLRYDISENPHVANPAARAARVLGTEVSNTYVHHLIYPHFVMTVSDVVVHIQLHLPTSPTTSCALVRAYTYYGHKRNPLAWIMARGTAFFGGRGVRQVLLEDAAIFDGLQKGIEASRYRGCIGTREERVYTFQRFVKERCGYPDLEVPKQEVAKTVGD